MPPKRRREPVPRRRRHDDEGEEDGSTAGDAQEYQSSEGSVNTDPEDDGDVSIASGNDEAQSTASPVIEKQQPSQERHFETTADTEAMLNGLKLQDGETVEELNFEDPAQPQDRPISSKVQHISGSRSKPQFGSHGRAGNQTAPSASRGHASHDDRLRGLGNSGPAGPRGRGRGNPMPNMRGNFNAGFGMPADETNKQWHHDLHETINKPAAPKPVIPSTAVTASAGPNRSFSTTTVLGNVPVQIFLPGNEKKISASMIKKHYTLLPQHRPPLRRDKPVRISIPDEHPRYIFPSMDRSFVFIPRAMRPNQHQFKGRGRGSFHGSRRTSMYGGSNYTPSIGMSRRPSIAASQAGSGIQTPTGPPSYHFQPTVAKPVVRMPLPGTAPFIPPVQHTEVYLGDNAAIIHSPPATLPMHQPVPQKTVSVADIESPTYKAPIQQSQQPFHQQIPQSMGDSQQKMPHIPEGAVYAQPFQPYPAVQPGYYGMQYPQTAMMVQPVDSNGYQMSMGGPVAHEQSGMVYYYDPSQQQYPPNYAPQMMNMMPPGGYYYPPFPNQFYQ